MWTGRQTLASIEGAIAKLHGEEGQLDQALALGGRRRRAAAQGTQRRRCASWRASSSTRWRPAGSSAISMPASAAPCRSSTTTACGWRPSPSSATALLKEVASAEAERHTAAAAVEAALEAVETLRAQAEAKVQTTPEWRAAKAATRRSGCRRHRGGEEGRCLGGGTGRQEEALRRGSAVRLSLAAPTSERPRTRPATLPAPSIAWSRNSSASAMRGPTTRP